MNHFVLDDSRMSRHRTAQVDIMWLDPHRDDLPPLNLDSFPAVPPNDVEIASNARTRFDLSPPIEIDRGRIKLLQKFGLNPRCAEGIVAPDKREGGDGDESVEALQS